MNTINRVAFLAIVSSLAGVACTASTSEDAGSSEGAVNASAACAPAGIDARVASDRLLACEALATEGSGVGEDFQSIYRTCAAYLTKFKSEAANRAESCMKRIELGASPHGLAFAWEELYECGYTALRGTCESPQSKDLCRRVISSAAQQLTSSQMGDPALVEGECVAFLSGLKSSARDEVVSRATKHGFPIYSCIEGLGASPDAEELCLAGDRPAEGTRADIAGRCDDYSTGEALKVCYQFVKGMRVGVADRFLTALATDRVDQAPTPDAARVHNIGIRTLREVCRAPVEVDAICEELVTKYTAAGVSNAGGRITRECRTLLPGLLASSRTSLRGGPVPRDGKIASAIVKLPVPTAASAEQFPEQD